ncbi:MAG: hypothetical protein DRG11_04110 [Epsilonproteobacteria bacterium]|nr:MAG: hypothetical protein DRG11_04110 [Campylobacterota bacterium]
MNRFKILFCLLLPIFGFAGLVDGVAIRINGDYIITLSDINNKMRSLNIDKQNAIKLLIDETLFEEQLKSQEIALLDGEVDDYVYKLSKRNGMSVGEFKQEVKKRQSYDKFIEGIKMEIKRYKLVQNISKQNLVPPDDEELEVYYRNNIQKFSKGGSIQVYPFEQVKKRIFEVVMKEKETKFLKEYFYKLRMISNIEIVR